MSTHSSLKIQPEITGGGESGFARHLFGAGKGGLPICRWPCHASEFSLNATGLVENNKL
jgi:hypothetical protein